MLKENKLGIMQGRLSPAKNNLIQHFPVKNWSNEFSLCSKLGLKCIEWIFELKNYNENPLYSNNAFENLEFYKKKYKIDINSVVADYFMEKKLFDENDIEIQNNLLVLKKLIKNCSNNNINIVEIPLVDKSSLKDDKNLKNFKNNLLPILHYADSLNIKISLETDLSPKKFFEFIKSFSPNNIYVNYDMGNSASLGYDPKEEIDILSKYIVNVHIKDRKLAGDTVPLGKGSVDFNSVFQNLKKINYKGDLILQAAREDLENSENKKKYVDTIKDYKKFILGYIK